jgi:hypothetical protein
MIEEFVFTQYKESEGNFGVGKVPYDISKDTEELHTLFYNEIPKDKLDAKTYHQWFKDFSPEIKSIVEKFQKNEVWQELCTTGRSCSVINVHEMDELYYSKAPPKKRKDLLLYGATSNFDPHVDGSFNFPGMHFYRVLIGLTPGNEKVETRFLKLDVNHKIQENDYIVFDFDKAQHQVINHKSESDTDTKYRIILKLHFLVCDNCQVNSLYMQSVKQSYIAYENVTRYVMQTGTDPKTPYEFFMGLLCILGNNYKVLALFFSILLFAWPFAYLWKKNRLWKTRLFYANTSWLVALFATTLILWTRYSLTGLR